MVRTISAFEDKEYGEGYKDDDGAHHGAVDSLLQSGILGFCMCGDPDENLDFIRAGLEHIDRYTTQPYEDWNRDKLALFGNDGIARFFWYWADKEGLTDHGSSVPGWLEPNGRELLALLREYQAMMGDGGKAG